MDRDIYSGVTRTTVIALVSNRTSVALSSAVDVRKYAGFGELSLLAELASAGTNPTLAVKLQHATAAAGEYTDVTGGAFETVTGAANDGLQALKVDFSALKGFIKVLPELGGTDTPTFTFGVALRGRLKNIDTPAAPTI